MYSLSLSLSLTPSPSPSFLPPPVSLTLYPSLYLTQSITYSLSLSLCLSVSLSILSLLLSIPLLPSLVLLLFLSFSVFLSLSLSPTSNTHTHTQTACLWDCPFQWDVIYHLIQATLTGTRAHWDTRPTRLEGEETGLMNCIYNSAVLPLVILDFRAAFFFIFSFSFFLSSPAWHLKLEICHHSCLYQSELASFPMAQSFIRQKRKKKTPGKDVY